MPISPRLKRTHSKPISMRQNSTGSNIVSKTVLRHPFLDMVQGLAPEDMVLGRVAVGEQVEVITAVTTAAGDAGSS
ncbi:MAG: hypothetical protein ACYCVD_19925 [Desulfitobacteriaceae bacterium]